MLHKYTDNIGYRFKRKDTDNTLDYEVEGQIFQYDKIIKTRKLLDPMTNTYITDTTEVWRTDWQLDFKLTDKLSKTNTPTEDDFLVIVSTGDKPIRAEGNKHRIKEYYEYDLTIT